MQSRAKFLGHAIHPVLIVFPLGLLSTAVIFDIIGLVTGGSGFDIAAFYLIGAGVIGGLLAGLFGFVDWLAVPSGTRAKRVGVAHASGNLIVLVLFAISWFLRAGATDYGPSLLAVILGFVALGVAGVAGWLGGELVERLGVGVDDAAGLDAPSSLHRPGLR